MAAPLLVNYLDVSVNEMRYKTLDAEQEWKLLRGSSLYDPKQLSEWTYEPLKKFLKQLNDTSGVMLSIN